MAVDHDTIADPRISVLIRASGRRLCATADRPTIAIIGRKIVSTAHRIDVHQHVVPPFWAKALPTHGGDPSGPRSGDPSNSVLPPWSPDSAIDFMDSQEIATGILSLTAPGVVGWDTSGRREMARRVNEYMAGLVAKSPERFGHFAT